MMKETFNYAAKLSELEGVLAALQDVDVTLDQAIKLHETGRNLVAELEQYLKEAEVIVKKQVVGKE